MKWKRERAGHWTSEKGSVMHQNIAGEWQWVAHPKGRVAVQFSSRIAAQAHVGLHGRLA